MKFKFRLEKVLTYYKSLEDEAKRKYSEAQDHLIIEKNKLDNLFQSIVDARKTAHDYEIQGGQTAERLVNIHTYIKGTEIYIEQQKKIVNQAAEDVEKKLQLLKEAAVQTRMIEKIKEKQLGEFKIATNKKEQKLIDEMITMRFGK